MCKRKSMLIVKGNPEPIWDLESDSHEELKKKFNQNDNKIYGRYTVSIEVIPKGDLFSTNPEDWNYEVDEYASVPSWYEEEKELWPDRCKRLLCETIIPMEKDSGKCGVLIIKKNIKCDWLKSVGGELYIYRNAELTAPKLESVGGDMAINSNAELTAPKLESVGGNLSINSNAELTAPKLESVGGDLFINSNAELTAPKLESVGGDLFINSNAELSAPNLETVNGGKYK